MSVEDGIGVAACNRQQVQVVTPAVNDRLLRAPGRPVLVRGLTCDFAGDAPGVISREDAAETGPVLADKDFGAPSALGTFTLLHCEHGDDLFGHFGLRE